MLNVSFSRNKDELKRFLPMESFQISCHLSFELKSARKFSWCNWLDLIGLNYTHSENFDELSHFDIEKHPIYQCYTKNKMIMPNRLITFNEFIDYTDIRCFQG